jgi:predicted transcriptional regulator YdeE
MATIIKELDEFYIIGISVRTSNREGKSQKDIGELFGAFFGNNLIEKIPDKKSNDVYCIYTDYESDFMGLYTTVIGCRVESLGNIPAGFTGVTIPKSKYLVYKSAGKLPECVGVTWGQIWQSDLNRKYSADFDVYGEKAQNPENAEVETYVSVN